MQTPKRGDIWIVQLDPTMGSEIKKTRPAVVVSNNTNNEYSDTATVVPITSSTGTIYPFEISILSGEGGLKYDSNAKANQIRTVDKHRLTELIGFLSDKKVVELERAIAVHLDLGSHGLSKS